MLLANLWAIHLCLHEFESYMCLKPLQSGVSEMTQPLTFSAPLSFLVEHALTSHSRFSLV